MSKIEIVNSSQVRIPRKFILKLDHWVRRKLKSSKLQTWQKKALDKELILVFLNDREALELNHEFRSKNYATDVLSFAPIEEESLGELIFCASVLKRQAQEHNLSFQLEIAYLYIHGVLHLLGFEHEKSKKEAELMFAIQDQLFEDLCSWLQTAK